MYNKIMLKEKKNVNSIYVNLYLKINKLNLKMMVKRAVTFIGILIIFITESDE